MAKKIKIATADCETDPFKYGRVPSPFLWGLYDGDNYYEFTNTRDFIYHVSDIDMVVYAHNGGKFDWHFVLNEIEIEPQIKIIAGRIAEFKIGKCRFRDSYNILPIPLAAYQKDEIDYAIFEPEERIKPENMRMIRDYLKSDCVYLYELVSEFIETYGFNITLASAALKFFSNMSGLKKPVSNAAYFNDMSEYYFGGRVQAFKTGVFKRDFKYIDLNSAYPFAMMSEHPYGLTRHSSKHLPDERDPTIFIKLRCKANGHFPVRTKSKSLDFPLSDEIMDFSITGHEYYAAEDLGLLESVEIIKVVSFEEKICFADYVNHFYELKEKATIEKDVAKRLFAKLFMNSLYGKYATNPQKYKQYSMRNIYNAEEFEIENMDFEAIAEFGDNILYQRDLYEDELRFLNVATAASITGAVRAIMMRALSTVSEPYYCDTDSIICENTSELELHPTKLGAWDVEAEATLCAIAGKKLYTMQLSDGSTKTASKGARLSHEEMIKVAKGETITWKSEAPTFSVKKPVSFNVRKIRKT